MRDRTPLDDIEFLARSRHRVRVLSVLAEEPQTRASIHDETGISQPTLGRILAGFQDRGWLSKEGRTYSLTPFGALLAAEFDSLWTTVDTMQRLQTLAQYLPLDTMNFDVRLFGDAKITTPHPPDVFAHARRAEELAREASHVRSLTANFYPDLLSKTRELVIESGQTQVAVTTAAALDGLLSQTGSADIARELLESGNMQVYRYEGEVSTGVALFDDVAVIFPYDANMRECALIETRNETIRSWVAEMLDDYQQQAREVRVEELL